VKIIPTEQYFTKKFYIEFHENSTSGLAADNRQQAKQMRPLSKACQSCFSRKLKNLTFCT